MLKWRGKPLTICVLRNGSAEVWRKSERFRTLLPKNHFVFFFFGRKSEYSRLRVRYLSYSGVPGRNEPTKFNWYTCHFVCFGRSRSLVVYLWSDAYYWLIVGRRLRNRQIVDDTPISSLFDEAGYWMLLSRALWTGAWWKIKGWARINHLRDRRCVSKGTCWRRLNGVHSFPKEAIDWKGVAVVFYVVDAEIIAITVWRPRSSVQVDRLSGALDFCSNDYQLSFFLSHFRYNLT